MLNIVWSNRCSHSSECINFHRSIWRASPRVQNQIHTARLQFCATSQSRKHLWYSQYRLDETHFHNKPGEWSDALCQTLQIEFWETNSQVFGGNFIWFLSRVLILASMNFLYTGRLVSCLFVLVWEFSLFASVSVCSGGLPQAWQSVWQD